MSAAFPLAWYRRPASSSQALSVCLPYWDKISVDSSRSPRSQCPPLRPELPRGFAEKWGKPYPASHGCGTARGKEFAFRSWTMMSKYGESRVLPTR